MPRSSAREELIQIQKKIFRKNQRRIQDSVLINESGFGRYEKYYQRRVQDFERTSSVYELKLSLVDAHWIYMGDYHTNRQSQRALLRTLKLLITQTDQFVIALEFLQKKHQAYVDRFLQDKISLKTFLKHINIKKVCVF